MLKYLFNTFHYLEQLHLGVIKWSKHQEMVFHDHDFSEIAIVLNTENSYHWVEGKSYKLQVGDVLLLHPGVTHAYQNTENLVIFNIIFNPLKMSFPTLDSDSLPYFRHITIPSSANNLPFEKPITTLKDEQLKKCEKLVEELKFELDNKLHGQYIVAISLFLQIITLIARTCPDSFDSNWQNRAEGALHYLNTHFNEEVNISQLAKISCLSERSLFIYFQELTGLTPMAYRKTKQLEQAEYLLTSSNVTLGDIAKMCGFYDSNHLGREFKIKYGISPGKYRKINNKYF